MLEYQSSNVFILVLTFPKCITYLLKLIQILNHWGWGYNQYTLSMLILTNNRAFNKTTASDIVKPLYPELQKAKWNKDDVLCL